MSERIQVMAGGLARDEIEQRMIATSESSINGTPWQANIEREIYYPYHWVLLRHRASTLLGTSAMPIRCVVDARTRLAATTDPFGVWSVERARLGAATIVDPQLSAADAIPISKRYAAYVMRNRRKALVESQVELVEQALVYKPMATVRVSHAVEDPHGFRVLVDGMSGAFHVLPAAPRETAAPRPVRVR